MADPTGINTAGKVANVGSNPPKTTGDDHDKMATMRSRLQMAQAAYSDSREDELDDLRFMAGSPDNQWQWPADVLATRGSVQGQTINARPCLTINKLPQHVRQVTNEQRQNRPSGKVILRIRARCACTWPHASGFNSLSASAEAGMTKPSGTGKPA